MTAERFDGVALLLLDLQNGLCRKDCEAGAFGYGQQVEELGVLEQAAFALDCARSRGMFVGYSRLAFDRDYSTLASASPRLGQLKEAGFFQSDGPGAAICSEIEPGPGELVVEKTGVDPFAGTPLLPALLRRGITAVVLAGVATEHAVECAARRCADLGISAVVLADACSSMTPQLREHALTETLPVYAVVTTARDYFA